MLRFAPVRNSSLSGSRLRLDTHRNTLGVAPTAAGKTIMLSAVAGETARGSDAKACASAHRDQLHRPEPDEVRARLKSRAFPRRSLTRTRSLGMASDLCHGADAVADLEPRCHAGARSPCHR